MARVDRSSIILNGLTGKIGGLTFSKRNGRTYVQQVSRRKKRKLSEREMLHQLLFKEAAAHAAALRRDPEKWEELKKRTKRGKTVFGTAVAEYMKAKRRGEWDIPVVRQ